MTIQNRGMYLESIINYTIEIYNNERKALIFKSSPKIIINNGRYYFLNQSTVDYHGVYQGKYLCFEAKTSEKSFLPWKNIKLHQWSFLTLAYQNQAISFIIIYFTIYKKYYLIFTSQLITLRAAKSTINFQWVKKNGHEIKVTGPFLLDFIKIL